MQGLRPEVAGGPPPLPACSRRPGGRGGAAAAAVRGRRARRRHQACGGRCRLGRARRHAHPRPASGALLPRAAGLGAAVTAALGAVGRLARVVRQHRGRRCGGPLGQAASAGVASEAAKDRFGFYRNITFVGMVLGYAVYYFTRLSFTYVGLAMRNDLGLSMVQLGAISSLFPLAYMNSKFISGVLSDLLGSPVLIFSVGLTLTGLLNIAFAMGSTVPWFTVIWCLNGLFQGCGATPCNKMLVSWFPAQSRGKWWSGWNASHNIGGFAIPLLAGGLAAAYSWRWGMIVPGAIAVGMGMATFCFMKDSPEKLGLPSAEEHAAASGGGNGMAEGSVPQEPVSALAEESPDVPVWKLLFRNRFLWCMSAMHFFIYFIRQGVLNWAHFYIMDQFGVPAIEATARVSGFELGGLMGCILSGQISDWLIGRYPEKGAAGLRTQVMVYYSLLATFAVLGLWVLPPVAAFQWLCMALFGFAIYGPQTLITMTGVETVPKRAAATAGGLLAYPAQLGSMCAGLPFAYLVQEYGWAGFFPSLVALSLASALVVLPGWNEPSYIQAARRRRTKGLAASGASSSAPTAMV